MILIVSWPGDDHADAVRGVLDARGMRATVVDLARFPQEMRLVASLDGVGRSYRLLDGREEIVLDDCRAVWWRRPRPFVLHQEIATGPHATFAYNEGSQAFAGLWLSVDASWINHPTREETGARKLYQLRVAQDVGLEIPKTVVTNDPDEARRFIDALGFDRVAYKTFMPTSEDWRETRVLRPDELDLIASVTYAPVIFQEYVPARFDLRVTVVGPDMFAAAIHSSETSYEFDYRMDLANARVEPSVLPEEIERRLRDLMDGLGLVYGAIDMRLTPDGRFVFFEVNPSGQWRFVEERSGQPITERFSELLAARSRAHHEERRVPPRHFGRDRVGRALTR